MADHAYVKLKAIITRFKPFESFDFAVLEPYTRNRGA